MWVSGATIQAKKVLSRTACDIMAGRESEIRSKGTGPIPGAFMTLEILL